MQTKNDVILKDWIIVTTGAWLSHQVLPMIFSSNWQMGNQVGKRISMSNNVKWCILGQQKSQLHTHTDVVYCKLSATNQKRDCKVMAWWKHWTCVQQLWRLQSAGTFKTVPAIDTEHFELSGESLWGFPAPQHCNKSLPIMNTVFNAPAVPGRSLLGSRV